MGLTREFVLRRLCEQQINVKNTLKSKEIDTFLVTKMTKIALYV